MKYCDLHCHSDYSDGSCTPGELIEEACNHGLSAVALTDHNTLDGIGEFLETAGERIDALAGCEFTTEYNGKELHLIGFFSNISRLTAIRRALEEQRERKAENNRQTIERLAAAGYDLSYEEFLEFAGSGSKNRVHIAKYMMQKGIVSSISEAFDGLLFPGNGYYEECRKLDFCKMISLIDRSGGVSIWAHPLYNVDQIECENILKDPYVAGLDGIEVFYSTYSDADTEFMINMSNQYQLLQSGGSDFHGVSKPDIKIGVGHGNLKVPHECFLEIERRLCEKDSLIKRTEVIERFLIDCCKASSIYYDGKYQSIKYLCGTGKVLFVERSRMLDYCEESIPDYDRKRDESLIFRIIDDSERLKSCESHSHGDCHYCWTFSLKQEYASAELDRKE